MELIGAENRWARPLVALLALLVIVWIIRAPAPTASVAPPAALRGATVPETLQGQFQAQAAPVAPAPIAGREPIVVAGPLALYTSSGSYSADQVRTLAPALNDALSYVSERTDMQLNAPVTVIFDRRAACGLDGATYTQRRVIFLYACPDIPTNRAVNILAHEFVHQLAHDRYGNAHLQADLILSEGLATWGAGKYWLGRESDFRAFVARNYAGNLLPLGVNYQDYGTIDAMNRLYYEWASLVDFVIATQGRDAFDRLYSSGQGMQPNTADYAGVLGGDLGTVEQQWKEWLSQ